MGGYAAWAQFDAPSLETRLGMLQTALDLVGPQAAVRLDPWLPGYQAVVPAEAGEAVTLPSAARDEVLDVARHLLTGSWHAGIELERPLLERWSLSFQFSWAPLGQKTSLAGIPTDVEFECRAQIHYLRPSGRKRSHEQVTSLGSQLFQLDLTQQLCTLPGVEACRVLVEQRVFNPLCYRLVFHADPRGFLADLADVVELTVRGGAAYSDARNSYKPLLTQGASSIYFCDRTREEINRMRSRLEELMPRLDAHELSGPITADLLRSAAARSGRYDTFESPTGGVGVRARPVTGVHRRHDYAQFPVVFLDEFYLDLGELLLGR